jgi:hypothetical protein
MKYLLRGRHEEGEAQVGPEIPTSSALMALDRQPTRPGGGIAESRLELGGRNFARWLTKSAFIGTAGVLAAIQGECGPGDESREGFKHK